MKLSLAQTLSLVVLAGSTFVGVMPASAQGYFRESCSNGNFTAAQWTAIGLNAAGTASTVNLNATTSNRPHAFVSGTGNPSAGGTTFAVALANGAVGRARIRAEVNGARDAAPATLQGLTLSYDTATGACVLGMIDYLNGTLTISQKTSASSMAATLATNSIPGFDVEEDYKLDFTLSGTTLTLRASLDGIVVRTIEAANVTTTPGRAGFAAMARSGQTVTLRGSFRDVVFNRLTRGDSDNDGSSEIYWHNRGDDSSRRGMLLSWRVGRGDDGTPSLLSWQYDDNSARWMDPSEYTIIGSGDVTGDGRDDLFVRRNSDGRVRVRFVAPNNQPRQFRLSDDSNGSLPTQFIPDGSGWASIGSAPAGWDAVGVGDFSGDGVADILWRNSTTGVNGLWLMDVNGTITWREIERVSDNSWKVQAVGDFNDDGSCDILWKNDSSGLVGQWIMDDSNVREFRGIAGAPGWSVVGVGDFDDNPSASDIMWMNNTTGDVGCWSMNRNGTIRGWKGLTTVSPSEWRGRN